MIPLLVHVDGSEIHTNSEWYVWSVSSPLPSRSNILDTKFQAVKVPHAMMRSPEVKSEVLRRVAAWFAYQFEGLQEGVGQPCDFDGNGFPASSVQAAMVGEELMGGFKACFIGIKSDLKARKESHFFPVVINACRFAMQHSLILPCCARLLCEPWFTRTCLRLQPIGVLCSHTLSMS